MSELKTAALSVNLIRNVATESNPQEPKLHDEDYVFAFLLATIFRGLPLLNSMTR